VDVPPDTAGTRWTYQITKGEQRKANMAFHVMDQSGQAVPIYTTRGTSGGFTQPATPTAGSSCNTFTFDASSSYDPDNDALAYTWDFGDGATAEGMRATHTYEEAGDFRVTLTATDTSSQPCGVARTEQIVHVNTPPVAVLEAPANACVAAGVRFSAARSRDSAGEPLRYRWDFGDGATAEGAEVTHAFEKGGAFTVQLVVDDGRGTSCSTDRAVATVRVNSPPTVSVEPSAAVCAGSGEPLSVVLSATGSSDPDLNTLSYRWDFGDGGAGEGAWISHVYKQGGRYTETVMVDDGTNLSCSTASAKVAVQVNRAPRVAISPFPVAHGCAREPVTFDASSSSDPDNDALTYRWDFGDDAQAEGSVAQHAYTAHGEFPVTLTVDDGSGMSCGAVTSSITADVNAPPVARFVVHGEDASTSLPPEQLR
jgi:PKD repeat protein